jgi:glycerol-3-phosphate acyltransferase PlsY
VLLAWGAVVAVAYLLGSIPSGLLIGALFFGVDVRNYGSRRTGATNVLRTLGRGPAAAALLMDVAKGAAAVAFARWLLPAEPWAHVLAALAAVAGHNWPVFVGFRGGRGVIVSIAAVGVLHFPVALAIVLLGLLLIWRTRYVSLGSLAGAAAAPPLFLLFYLFGRVPLAYLAFAAAGAALVIASHHDNIARLLTGTESRLGQRARPAA